MAKSNKAKDWMPDRPVPYGSPPLLLRLPQELMDRFEKWRKGNKDFATRQDAIRWLIEKHLEKKNNN